MVDFDKFEKNVKNKYGNQEFPFDELNWEKAAKMIDASRKGKNRGGIIFLSAIALLCTTGLVYYFGFSDAAAALENNNVASNGIVQNNSNSISGNNIGSNPEEKTTVVSETENNNTGTNSSDNSVINTGSDINSNKTTKTNNKNNVVSQTANGSEKSKADNTLKENNSRTADSENTNETKVNSTSANTNTEPTSSETKPTATKKPTQTKSNTQTTTPSVLGNNVVQNSPKSVAPNVTTGVTGSTEKLGDVSNTSEEPTKTNIAVTDSVNEVAVATVKPTESVIKDSVPTVRKSRADSLAAMLPKGDGISYATNVKEKHNAKNYLFMEAGTTYLFGWNSNGNTEAGGFNLLAGVNFQHYFTNTISAQIGVQYNSINNLTNTSHTISTVKYDFGMEQDVTSIKYQRLHYLVAPLKFVFNVGDKNYIGIGCNVGYLLNSESKKEKYKTNSNDPNAIKKDLSSSKELGYVEGFNPYDIQLSASYRRRIYKGLSANAEFIYGLTDTKDNTFFNSKSFDRNMGLKISLCFDLFKK